MTDIFNLQHEIDRLIDSIEKSNFYLQRLRKALVESKRCDHSKVADYPWEHDSGYGKQTIITGKRCLHCLFVDLWGRGHFVDPETFVSNLY